MNTIIILTAYATIAINLIGMKVCGFSSLSWGWTLLPTLLPVLFACGAWICWSIYDFISGKKGRA